MVEDDATLRRLISGALVEMGHDVLVAANGPEALELLRSDTPIDVVFSDVSMPHGMSGIELIEHATKLQPQARCILASGYAKAQLPPLPERVLFLAKPYRIPQLMAAFTA